VHRRQSGNNLRVLAGSQAGVAGSSYDRLMKAVIVETLGGPENLKYTDVSKPEPGEGARATRGLCPGGAQRRAGFADFYRLHVGRVGIAAISAFAL